RDPSARRARDDVAAAHRVLFVSEEEGALAVEDDEKLFLRRVAVRRRSELPRRDVVAFESRVERAGGATEVVAGARDRRAFARLTDDLVGGDDRRRTGTRGRELGRTDGSLTLERMRAPGLGPCG